MLMSYKPKDKVSVITDMNNIVIPSIWKRGIFLLTIALGTKINYVVVTLSALKVREIPGLSI